MTQEGSGLPHTDVLQMTTQVVAAYVGHNSVGEAQIPTLSSPCMPAWQG